MNHHTEGPWIVQTHYGREPLHDDNSDTDFAVVLPLNGSYPEDTICEVWGTEHDHIANATFIATAPDMLLALVEIVRIIDSDGNESTAFDRIKDISVAVIKRTQP